MQYNTTSHYSASPGDFLSISGYFFSPFAGTPDIFSAGATLIGHSGTASNFTVACVPNASPADNIFTIFRNGAPTTLQARVLPGQSYGIDAINTELFTATDVISIGYDNTNGDMSSRFATALTFTLDP